MFHILGLFFFGLFVGIIAKWIMPGRDPGGFIVTGLIGIAGSFVGSYLGEASGLYRHGEPAGWVLSVVGALVLLGVYRLVTGSRSQQ